MSDPELVFAFARGQNAFFRELAAALVFELEQLGGRGRIVVGDLPPQVEGSVTVLLPPHEFVSLTELDLSPAVLGRSILISAEQPTSSFFAANVALAHRAGAVLDINHRAVRAYQDAGVPAGHLQLGYSQAWDKREDVPERDIDVLFIGRATKRRELALALYADVLERFNCQFILSDNRTPNSDEGLNFVTGEGKLRLLARSKVLLNVHGEDEPYFEWLRAAEAISSGCVVVTEHSTDMEPLRPGVDLIAASYESLGLLTAGIIDDRERRARMALEAESRLRSSAPLATAAARLLATARGVNERPVTPQGEADVQVARARLTIGRVTPAPPPPPAPEIEISPGEQRALRALKRQQQELLSLRRRLARNELRHSRPDQPEPETVEVAATRAWGESRPLISVIVPLYNDADVVGEALDSVRRSTMSSWEIVVVDDASTDSSSATVRAWMDEHPDQRVSLVRHEVNRGLPAARNTGAEEARGDLLLMLDSDNLVRPFGLARLTGALCRDPGADFAYGLLDRFQGDEPHGTISKFAWEPARLREDNYIDAFSLIRRRVLSELDGYSEDARLWGLEDYDLWARMAEAGRRGTFVRQFVGRYRVGHSSMLSVTGISSIDAFAAISEHAPKLMRDARIPA
jgi:hypothetical protein